MTSDVYCNFCFIRTARGNGPWWNLLRKPFTSVDIADLLRSGLFGGRCPVYAGLLI